MQTNIFSSLAIGLGLALSASAQVKTEVPEVLPGAKPATVEHIKIHGAALEGNLEGDAVDRDAIVFLPPSYATNKTRPYPVVYALHGAYVDAHYRTIAKRTSRGLVGQIGRAH